MTEPNLAPRLESWIEQRRGVLRLKPTYVRRFYQDGGRLGLADRPGGTYQPDSGLWVPERWIASTVTAANLHPIEGEELSFLDIPGAPVSLKAALEALGPGLLGEAIFRACGPEFRVLSKILDPYEPIVFHIHARGADVRSHPEYFPGRRRAARAPSACIARRNAVTIASCDSRESLRLPALPGAGRKWIEWTPAMAAGLTAARWSMREWLGYPVPPEGPAVVRRRRPPEAPRSPELALAA